MKNHRSTATADSPEQVVAHLRKLLTEAEDLVGDNGEPAESKIDVLKARLSDAQERLGEFYVSARKKVIAGAKRTDETIREYPYQSLAVALGIGVLIGALLKRRSE